MKFIWDIRKSIYGPNYYKELTAKSFWHSFKYYLLLAIILAVITAVSFLFSIFPAVKVFINNAESEVLNYYPDELQIFIKNGQASTNVAEPYFLKLPPEIKESVTKKNNAPQDLENLLVIDTKNEFNIDQFKNYKTLVLLGKKNAVYYGDGKITIQSLEKISDFKLDKPLVVSMLEKVRPYLRFIFPVVAIVIFFVMFLGIDSNLFYLLFAALIIWFIARRRKIAIGYKKSYQLGLHLMTPALLLDSLLLIISPNLHITFLFTGVTLITAVFNLRWKTEGATTQVTPPIAAPQL